MSRVSVGLGRPSRLVEPVLLRPVEGSVRLRVSCPAFPWKRQREEILDDDRPTVPPPTGARAGDSDVVLVLDVSGSTGSTDPGGHRFTAARRIVNLLAEGGAGGRFADRVGVVLFADSPVPWLPLTPLDNREQRRRVRSCLRPINGGGTSIVPAIERAAGILGRRSADHSAVLLFTDGESDETSSEFTAAVLKAPTGSVHVVVLGQDLPAQWDSVPVGSVTALPSLDGRADALEWLLARALYRSLGLGWAGPEMPPTAALPGAGVRP